MPRYLVQRTFADHLEMPTNGGGANAAASSSPTTSPDPVIVGAFTPASPRVEE